MRRNPPHPNPRIVLGPLFPTTGALEDIVEILGCEALLEEVYDWGRLWEGIALPHR